MESRSLRTDFSIRCEREEKKHQNMYIFNFRQVLYLMGGLAIMTLKKEEKKSGMDH